MKFFLTLGQTVGSNTTQYITIGCYDTRAQLERGIKCCTHALLLAKRDIIEITPVNRDDGESWYITYK